MRFPPASLHLISLSACVCVRHLCLQETENHTQNGFRREETLWTLPGVDQIHKQSLVWPPFLGPSPLMCCPPTLIYIFSDQIECKHTRMHVHTHTHTHTSSLSISHPILHPLSPLLSFLHWDRGLPSQGSLKPSSFCHCHSPLLDRLSSYLIYLIWLIIAFLWIMSSNPSSVARISPHQCKPKPSYWLCYLQDEV